MSESSVAKKIKLIREQFQQSLGRVGSDPGIPVSFTNFQNFPTDFHNWDQFNKSGSASDVQD